MAQAVETKEKKTKKTVKQEWYSGTGRRKTSVARVRVFLGKEPMIVNDHPIDVYFPGVSNKKEYEKALNIVSRLDSITATIKVAGGGRNSQLGAVIHGLANALVAFDSTFRAQLSVAGLLTRDSRMRERRKVGTGGRARRQKSSPKR